MILRLHRLRVDFRPKGDCQRYRPLSLSGLVMDRFAATRADLRRTGQTIPGFDILVAATALHHALTVLTCNLRHFQRIPALRM